MLDPGLDPGTGKKKKEKLLVEKLVEACKSLWFC